MRGKVAAVGIRDAGRDGGVRALLCAGCDLRAEVAAVDEQGERRADLRALRLRKGAQRRIVHGKAEAVGRKPAHGAQLRRVVRAQIVQSGIRDRPDERIVARKKGGACSIGVRIERKAHRLGRDVVRVPVGGVFHIGQPLVRPCGDRVRPADGKARAVRSPAHRICRTGGHRRIRRLGAKLQEGRHGLREHNGERASVGRRRDVQAAGTIPVDTGKEIRRRRILKCARPVPRIDKVRRRERRAVRPREAVTQRKHILYAPVGQRLRHGQLRTQLGRQLPAAVTAGAIAGQAGKEVDHICCADTIFRARRVERRRLCAEAERQRLPGIRGAHGTRRGARAAAEQQRCEQDAQKCTLHAGHLPFCFDLRCSFRVGVSYHTRRKNATVSCTHSPLFYKNGALQDRSAPQFAVFRRNSGISVKMPMSRPGTPEPSGRRGSAP